MTELYRPERDSTSNLKSHEFSNMDALIPKIKELALKETGLEILWLYGSRAKGNAHSESDYDLAIAVSIPDLTRFERADHADEIAYQWRVALGLAPGQLSVVDINSVPILLANTIILNSSVLYCANGLRLAREENRISGLMEDFKYLKGA